MIPKMKQINKITELNKELKKYCDNVEKKRETLKIEYKNIQIILKPLPLTSTERTRLHRARQ